LESDVNRQTALLELTDSAVNRGDAHTLLQMAAQSEVKNFLVDQIAIAYGAGNAAEGVGFVKHLNEGEAHQFLVKFASTWAQRDARSTIQWGISQPKIMKEYVLDRSLPELAKQEGPGAIDFVESVFGEGSATFQFYANKLMKRYHTNHQAKFEAAENVRVQKATFNSIAHGARFSRRLAQKRFQSPPVDFDNDQPVFR